jgi:flagellar motility protein MotE (MotC chaperone)
MTEPNKGEPKDESAPIEKVAQETCDAIIRHLQSVRAENEQQLEAARDARIKDELEKLAAEGKLPPRKHRDDP